MQSVTKITERRRLLAHAFPEPRSALFLDRDGVIIEDCHYISSPEQVRLCPGARWLIGTSHQLGWPVVVVTNQSGIARGLVTWDGYEAVNARMLELLGPGAPLAAVYANGHGPHTPEQCWRKPSPMMLLNAAEELNLDLKRSIMVGDRLSDLQAGASAGVEYVVHVLRGHGMRERKSVLQWHATMALNASTPDEEKHAYAPRLVELEGLDAFPFNLLSRHDQSV